MRRHPEDLLGMMMVMIIYIKIAHTLYLLFNVLLKVSSHYTSLRDFSTLI
ncbi:hypothetical protein P4S72_14550 [Vibrio sp. PP-XX7]